MLSLQDPPAVTEPEDMVVIYNRVPKTGSTSFAGIAYELCLRNKFHVLHLNVTKNNHVLSISDQVSHSMYLLCLLTLFVLHQILIFKAVLLPTGSLCLFSHNTRVEKSNCFPRAQASDHG